MIAVCPKCNAKYRVDTARLGPEGAKLRCSKCSALFLVRVPATATGAAAMPKATGAAAASAAPPTFAPMPAAAVSASPVPSTLGADQSAPGDPARLVVVADPDAARGKRTAESLRGIGLEAHLVHDGVEAMLAIQRMLPRVVVLDAALPRMYGFQVCEVVKRNASLRHITVVLVGAVHDPNRYRRDPSDLYGADAYLEQPDLPDGLHPILRGCGMPMATPTTMPMPTPRVAMPPAPPIATPARVAPPPQILPPQPVRAAAPAAPMPTPAAAMTTGDPAKEEERERARRLARIAVSEMLLYQPEKFAQASRDGTLERVLDAEIQEARALLRQRISAEVRAEGDFVLEELHRVARERGAKA